MTNNLLYHLYDLALQYGGEVHADMNEVVLCFPSLDPTPPPKRQDDESWPTQNQVNPAPVPAASSSMTTATSPPSSRHAVLNDMKQFLQEQEMQRLSRSLYEDGKNPQKFRTGEMPYRNYPEGRPPNR